MPANEVVADIDFRAVPEVYAIAAIGFTQWFSENGVVLHYPHSWRAPR